MLALPAQAQTEAGKVLSCWNTMEEKDSTALAKYEPVHGAVDKNEDEDHPWRETVMDPALWGNISGEILPWLLCVSNHEEKRFFSLISRIKSKLRTRMTWGHKKRVNMLPHVAIKSEVGVSFDCHLCVLSELAVDCFIYLIQSCVLFCLLKLLYVIILV